MSLPDLNDNILLLWKIYVDKIKFLEKYQIELLAK